MASFSLDRIPNNVDLSSDPRLQKALELWQPNFARWWQEMGPSGFQQDHIYLRTAVDVAPGGWAHFDFVRMPEYRWGIFLAPSQRDRVIGFGDNLGRPVWNEVPGELRKELRRIIVTQGDTEPASVEQQRQLGQTAPSLYDLRNLFQVNVEEGRHLWAMVYLLHRYFGRDGREEAEEMLVRHSGDADTPRLLEAFNKPIASWLDFFCFAMFADRDGKYQLAALAESGFDPLARSTQFMLTEEAHHLFVGETGIGRIVERTAELMVQDPSEDVTRCGGIPLDMIQRYVNEWFSTSLDLFGGEDSSNAARYFAAGLKGRYRECSDARYDDHVALESAYRLCAPGADGALHEMQIPMRRAMNAILRDSYADECRRAVERWNVHLRGRGIGFTLRLPSLAFNRRQGVFAGMLATPAGQPLVAAEFDRARDEFLPSSRDRAYVASLMVPVYEPGKIAGWIAPPRKGINGKPPELEYVRRASA
ncbi:MAG: benzoyl-CoA 2,3-epoxidase subunit BoxB [Candidatus Schekmanbacteria bacterium]|nr:benzoyl-CoA 2,3-epoxidase subunit BoxB [Candidatus Schekmanbacteria bacterium]